MPRTLSGWLFDVYPSAEGVTLWLIDRNSGPRRCFRKYTPSFFLHINDADAHRIEALGAKCPVPVSFQRTTRKEIYSGDSWMSSRCLLTIRRASRKWYGISSDSSRTLRFYNSDILVAQLFLYETQLFPLALGEYEISEAGELTGWTINDSREATEYELPPLSVMSIRNANDFVPRSTRSISSSTSPTREELIRWSRTTRSTFWRRSTGIFIAATRTFSLRSSETPT